MREALYIQRRLYVFLPEHLLWPISLNILHNELNEKSTCTLIISGNNFNLREVCRGKGVTIAAILIHKESKVSLPRDAGCHCRWEQGENAYHPNITFIWLCICKP